MPEDKDFGPTDELGISEIKGEKLEKSKDEHGELQQGTSNMTMKQVRNNVDINIICKTEADNEDRKESFSIHCVPAETLRRSSRLMKSTDNSPDDGKSAATDTNVNRKADDNTLKISEAGIPEQTSTSEPDKKPTGTCTSKVVDNLMGSHKSCSEGFITAHVKTERKRKKVVQSKAWITDSDATEDDNVEEDLIEGMNCHTKWAGPKTYLQIKRMNLKKIASFDEDCMPNKENIVESIQMSPSIKSEKGDIDKSTVNIPVKQFSSSLAANVSVDYPPTSAVSTRPSGDLAAQSLLGTSPTSVEEVCSTPQVASHIISRHSSRRFLSQRTDDSAGDLETKRTTVMRRSCASSLLTTTIKNVKAPMTTRQKLLKRITSTWKKPSVTAIEGKNTSPKKVLLLSEAITPANIMKRGRKKSSTMDSANENNLTQSDQLQNVPEQPDVHEQSDVQEQPDVHIKKSKAQVILGYLAGNNILWSGMSRDIV